MAWLFANAADAAADRRAVCGDVVDGLTVVVAPSVFGGDPARVVAGASVEVVWNVWLVGHWIMILAIFAARNRAVILRISMVI